MTPSSSSLFICVRMAAYFSAEWCRGGRRLRGTSRYARSISMTIGSTCAGRDRTDIEKMPIYSLQRLLSCSWSVSGSTLSGRISNRSVDVISSSRCHRRPRLGPVVDVMGSPMTFLRDKRAIRPLYRHRTESIVIPLRDTAVTSPVSHLTQTSFTTHSVQYTQYTLSVHFFSLL